MRYLAIFAVLLMAGCVITSPANQSVNQTGEANYSVQVVTYSASPYELKGYLFVPSGPGPFPAIIYNHGSEEMPGPKEPVAAFFAQRGYVTFVPHRRGQGLSEGPYIGDLTAAAGQSERSALQTELLAAQADDVEAAAYYVKNLSFVYPDRVAVMGCSYGGIETLFTAERDLGLKAAVDFAGDSESWGNTILRERLKQAVVNSTVPVFFLQAENDYHTEPTEVFSAEMLSGGHEPAEAKIYPPYGTTPEEGHGGFCMNPSIWGDDVLSFIRKFGV
ncbi:MAG TPA: dienelactone hydrolase family protein [Candidatus Bilamarchaeum sp.]|nr:dienelactone hydrolase family protein [Candidatus Bilamarchaeum sp.]